jgi:hypothetical protein
MQKLLTDSNMKNENLQAAVFDGIGPSDGVRIGFTDHRTNRSIIHHDDQHPTKVIELDTLIIEFVKTGTAELKEFLLPLVQNFSIQLPAIRKTYFRGLRDSKTPHRDRIGPPQKPKKDNRYSVIGETCLYLIDDIHFLDKELGTSSFWIQEYDNIPFDKMRIADLSSENSSMDNNLTLAFQRAESGRTASGYEFEDELKKKGKSPYLMSQLLAACFKKENWDGIYVPGVHGERGKYYHNLSIFEAKVSNWRDWTTRPYYHN